MDRREKAAPDPMGHLMIPGTAKCACCWTRPSQGRQDRPRPDQAKARQGKTSKAVKPAHPSTRPDTHRPGLTQLSSKHPNVRQAPNCQADTQMSGKHPTVRQAPNTRQKPNVRQCPKYATMPESCLRIPGVGVRGGGPRVILRLWTQPC